MNESIFRFINNLAGQWPWLDTVAIFCAEYLMYVLLLIVVVYTVSNYRRWRDLAIVAIGSALVARLVIAQSIKMLYDHPRPYWLLSDVNLLLAKEMESSFPSGHVIFVFALATGVYFYNKSAGRWFLGMAVLVGVARVFVGVHWPYDIIVGAVLGVATAYICNWLYQKFFKN